MHPGSFYRWKRGLGASGDAGGERGESPLARGHGHGGPLFAEVVVQSPGGEAALEVVLGRGRRVWVHPGFDDETLARVVAVLERVSC